MKYVGVDLHKKTITVCVVILVRGQRKVFQRQRFACCDTAAIAAWFKRLGKFRVAVEATASYEWFVQLVESLAERVVLVHPKKLRVIAESKRKSDKIDAFVLAEFLALDMLPEAWRPTPRVREHRTLVRHRVFVQRRITSVKNKLRRILANHNADISHLFSAAGCEHLDQVPLSPAERLTAQWLQAELAQHRERLAAANRALREFAAAAPLAEREARAVLATMTGVGPVTIDVVLSELGDFRRFRSQSDVASYAGLTPGFRESDGKKKILAITKEGSRLLRWAMIELAWRLVNKTRRWASVYERVKTKAGAKKAIVAVARRALCVLHSLLTSGQKYSLAALAPSADRTTQGSPI